jgi:competence protein ComEC
MELDGVRFDFLWPDAEAVDAPGDTNEISAVLLISYGEFSALLAGDAGADVEAILVRRLGTALRSEVLKLGHHGSTTSTSPLFLETVDPELAVISSGRRNRYGHPAPAVVAEVESRKIPIARTDREGTVSIKVQPGGREWTRLEW